MSPAVGIGPQWNHAADSGAHARPAEPSLAYDGAMEASIAEDTTFRRTLNNDGSHSSRCLYCLHTVASNVELLPELDRLERRHICPEKALAQLRSRGLVPLKRPRES